MSLYPWRHGTAASRSTQTAASTAGMIYVDETGEAVGDGTTRICDLVTTARGDNARRYRGFGAPQNPDPQPYVYPIPPVFGPLTPPPLSEPRAPADGVDKVAAIYDDFGRWFELLSQTQANGSFDWSTWLWNSWRNTGDGVTSYGYDPNRHPILGYFQGDNPVVLDWLCYWMLEHGVNVWSLVQPGGFTTSAGAWNQPANSYYWVYQLFSGAVPNFSALQFMLWIGSGSAGNVAAIEARDDEVVNQYATQPNAYTYTENGLRYAVVFIWDAESRRGAYDNYVGATQTTAGYKTLAAKFQATGIYDGVMIVARNAGVVWTNNDPTLATAGVIFLNGTYEGRYGSDASYGNLYSNYAATAPFPAGSRYVTNVVPTAKSQYPHPSGWNLNGSTPQLWSLLLQRAVANILEQKARKILTIYATELAEGGKGLIPSIPTSIDPDGFAYLRALANLPARGGGHTTGTTSGGGNTPKVTVFNAGTGQTFTPQSWTTLLLVACIGPSGAGGGGAQTASGTACSGAASGSGGGYAARSIPRSQLGATETVNVGTGGTGGAAATSPSSPGANGGDGSGSTTFGNHLRAGAGLGGTGGQISTASTGGLTGGSGQNAGAIGVGCPNGGAGNSGIAAAGGPSGGSGGGIPATPASTNGGVGGACNQNGLAQGTAGVSGTPNGGNGASGATGEATPGTGGGGGYGNAAGNGGNGGKGGTGAGGGGGGSCLNGSTPGAGGAGGDGICVVIEI